MNKTINILLLLLLAHSSGAQNFVFKIRKVPELKYFVFADGFNNHNLDKKSKEEIEFPNRLYLQIYDNDTFLIRWSKWKLNEANTQLDYLKRDSLTFAGKIKRQGGKGMKFSFPFEGNTFQMFSMSEEPLVQKKEYKAGPMNAPVKMVKFFFNYNKKLIVLADLEKEKVDKNPEIEEALKLSARIKLGFYSNDLYSAKKLTADLPLNIIHTYPVHFILANSNSCDQKLYWNGITTTKTLNLKDTSIYRRERSIIEKMPEDVLININGPEAEYYVSRRYVFLKNDSQIYVSNLNRGCVVFNDSLNQIDSIPIATYWDARDGVNNYFIQTSEKLWGWASRYGCTVEWRIYDEKAVKKLLKLPSETLFKKLLSIPTKSAVLLNKSCSE